VNEEWIEASDFFTIEYVPWVSSFLHPEVYDADARANI